MQVLIIGGAGAFGSFYAKLLGKNGFAVSISDLNETAGKALCEENGFSWVGGKDSLKNFDIAIVSVPNKAAPSAIKAVGPRLSKGSLLVDFCSVKTGVVKELKKLSPLGLELASIHPLHGPRVESIAGNSVACIEINPGQKLEILKKFFEKNKAEFFLTTAEEHDECLSTVQGLTHYAQFISAAVLKELGANLKASTKFASPNHQLFLSLVSRVILQNPELYAQIQLSNPKNKKIWTAFREKAIEFEKICKKGSTEVLEKKIIDVAKIFQGNESVLWQSDRAVNAIKFAVETLKNHEGKRFMVENTLTGKPHYGVITGVSNNCLFMSEKGKKTEISLAHIRLITKKEMQEWREKNLKSSHLDYSFLVPKESKKETILACLGHTKKYGLKILDEYEGGNLPEGKKSITLRATFFEDDKIEEIDKKIKETINCLGFGFR